MRIYQVTEYITNGMLENAEGFFSTKEKAKEAILARVAEEYTPEEMENFHFDEKDTYVTEETEWVAGCTYCIDDVDVDEGLA